MNPSGRRQHSYRSVAFLVLLTLLVFAPVVWRFVFHIPASDYQVHIQFAQEIVEKGKFVSAHVMFQALTITVAKLFSTSYSVGGWLTATLFYALTVLILSRLVRERLPAGVRHRELKAGLCAILLLLVTPLSLPTLVAHNLYLGYIGINVLHNPTMVLLKPFALLLFLLAVQILQGQRPRGPHTIMYGTTLVLLCLQAKPNFVLILLPALLLVIAVRLAQQNRVHLDLLTAALVMPMFGLLAMEYLVQFLWLDGGGGIALSPRLALQQLGYPTLSLVLRFFLSILFPLAVYVLYRRDSSRDLGLNLSWLIFVIGAAQMYLFVETGDRQTHGNFWWSAQIGLFVCFVYSTLFWLPHLKRPLALRDKVCIGVLGLHVVTGLIFYLVQFRSALMSDWW